MPPLGEKQYFDLSAVPAEKQSGNVLFETAYSLGREAELITRGVGGAFADVVHDPGKKLPELGVSLGIGTAFGALSRAGAPGRLIGAGIGVAMLLKMGYDEVTGNRWSTFGNALVDTWHSGKNMDQNVLATKNSFGSFVVDMGIGYGGMKIGGGIVGAHSSNGKFLESKQKLELIKTAEGGFESPPAAGLLAERFSFQGLRNQMSKAGVTEEGILASIKPENQIGRGGNATVYRIDGISDFVIRVPGLSGKHPELGGLLESVADIFPEGNVGQAVGRIGKANILKAQEGIAAGGPLYSDAKLMGETAARGIYEQSILRAAEMPQSAYDDFARTLLALDKKRLNFDPSKANNVLIDAVNKRFNLVDISPRAENSTYSHSLSDMVVTLMDNGFINSMKDRGAPFVSSYQSIVSKSIQAAHNTGLPLSLQSSSLQYSFQLARLGPAWIELNAAKPLVAAADADHR